MWNYLKIQFAANSAEMLLPCLKQSMGSRKFNPCINSFFYSASCIFNFMEPESAKKRKSRTKNSDTPDQRKYECHCGKKYLSYSALYTHSKQKHGVTITTKVIVDSRSEGRQETRAKNSTPRLYADPGMSPVCPANSFIGYRNGEISWPHNPQKQFISIESTIALYLSEQKKRNPMKMKNTVFILERLVNCINENSHIIENFDCEQHYSEKKSAAFIPLIFNFYLLEYLPKSLKMEPADHILLKQTIAHFGKWLYDNKFTLFECSSSGTQRGDEE